MRGKPSIWHLWTVLLIVLCCSRTRSQAKNDFPRNHRHDAQPSTTPLQKRSYDWLLLPRKLKAAGSPGARAQSLILYQDQKESSSIPTIFY